MSWKEILKSSSILEKVDTKQKKKLKKLLQKTQPTEYMGQEMTHLSDLLDEMKKLDLIKSDKRLQKKFESFDEKNLDIVSSAAELRKDYETLYRQIRDLVYPKSKGDLEWVGKIY